MSIRGYQPAHPYAVRTIDHERPYDVRAGEAVSMHDSAADAARTVADCEKPGEWRVVAFDGFGRPRPLRGRDMMEAARILAVAKERAA